MINLKVLSRMLGRLDVGTICTVDSGAKALATMEEQVFDLVITDLQMPNMSGTELSEAIRERKFCNNSQPIVVGLTAEENESVDALCIASGMERVLHKPITQQGLSEFLECFVTTYFPLRV